MAIIMGDPARSHVARVRLGTDAKGAAPKRIFALVATAVCKRMGRRVIVIHVERRGTTVAKGRRAPRNEPADPVKTSCHSLAHYRLHLGECGHPRLSQPAMTEEEMELELVGCYIFDWLHNYQC